MDKATSQLASTISLEEENTVTSEIKTNNQATDVDSEVDVPFKERKLPAYISLKTNASEVNDDVIVIKDDEEKQTGILFILLL